MIVRARASLLWIVLLLFATLAATQDLPLAFVTPNLTSPTSNNGGALPYFTIGQYVGVSWTSPFAETSLTLYELGDDGIWILDTLAGM